MKNQRGLSTLEVIMSVGFLAALVIVCSHIFKKQQIEMINAIQDIEITSTINEMRQVLKGEESCTASFENKKIGSRDIKVIKKIVQYPSSDEFEEIEAFPLFQYGRISFGEYKLKISDYRLTNYSSKKGESKEQALKLLVTFDKGLPDLEAKNFSVKEVKLYANVDSLGRVESCSLSKKVDNDGPFISLDGHMVKEFGGVGLGTNLIPSPLSIKNGIQLLEVKNDQCGPQEEGIIFNNEGELYICYNQFPFKISNLAVKGL